MASPRHLALAALLIAMPMMAGCNVKDWYNQEGHVVIKVAFQGDRNTSLGDFRSVKAAIYGVTMRQADAADVKHFAFPDDDPLIVDVVEKGRKQESITIADFKTNLRASDRVALRIVTFEAIDAAGNSMPICRLKDAVSNYPCFYQPDNSALLYEEKPFSPPRGGTVTVGFPVSVMYAQKGRVAEYFLYADPGAVTLEVDR